MALMREVKEPSQNFTFENPTITTNNGENGFYIKKLVPKEEELKKIGIKTKKDLEFAQYLIGILYFLAKKNISKGRKNWFFSFSAKYLKKKCRNYKQVIEKLENAGILVVNHHYSNDPDKPFCKSYRYCFNSIKWNVVDFWVKGEFVLTKKSVGKQAAKVEVGEIYDENCSYFINGHFLSKEEALYFCKVRSLTIHENAFLELKKRYVAGDLKVNKHGKKVDEHQAYLITKKKLEKIRDGQFYFKVSKNFGRIFHDLNGLPSYYRKYIIDRFTGERIVEMDLVSSHPSILRTQVKKDKLNIWDSTKDKYQLVMDKLGCSREEAKGILLKALNGCKWNLKKASAFINEFMESFDMKTVFNKEAAIVNRHVNIFDSIIPKLQDVHNELKELVRDFKNQIGTSPNLKISCWACDLGIYDSLPWELKRFVEIDEIYDDNPFAVAPN